MKKYFNFNGKKIFYTDNGAGIPIVLIHGYLETGEIWEDFGSKLANDFRVLTIDLPGHGDSEMLGTTHSMELMADVVNSLIKETALEKAFVVGHSMGGYVTLALLEKYSFSLSGYCLFHSHPFADTPEIIKKRKNEIEIVKAGNRFLLCNENIRRLYAEKNLEKFSKAVENSKRIASTISAGGIIAVLRGMMARPSRQHVMEQGIVPCLWILGVFDNHISCEEMKTRVKLPPNAELFILENSGHMGFIEEEEVSLRVLKSFINRNIINNQN
ncbi:MAG: alpha/beta hydrolase [Bacteroidales bacterium]|nr:alpha/beta hydrolase [Bacteroidales bacterium]